MKLVEFTYTKESGEVSNRAVIEVQQPAKHFEGIDVTGLDTDAFAHFVQDYRELKNSQQMATMELLAKHDLKHNYRRFRPEQMAKVIAEHV